MSGRSWMLGKLEKAAGARALIKYGRDGQSLTRRGGARLIGTVVHAGARGDVSMLIRAMAELVHVQGRSDLRCVIVDAICSSDPDCSSVDWGGAKWHELTLKLDLQDYILFGENLSAGGLEQVLTSLDIALMPFAQGGAQRDGVRPDNVGGNDSGFAGRQMLQYMQIGLPIVQSENTAGRKFAGNAALYVDDQCPLELAGNLAALLDDQAFYAMLSELGRHRAAKFSMRRNDGAVEQQAMAHLTLCS